MILIDTISARQCLYLCNVEPWWHFFSFNWNCSYQAPTVLLPNEGGFSFHRYKRNAFQNIILNAMADCKKSHPTKECMWEWLGFLHACHDDIHTNLYLSRIHYNDDPQLPIVPKHAKEYFIFEFFDPCNIWFKIQGIFFSEMTKQGA